MDRTAKNQYFYWMVLVTGGTGLVGSYLLMFLTAKGVRVRATYRRKEKQEDTIKIFEAHGKQNNYQLIDWVEADVLDVYSLEAAFAGVEYVYHCAAIVSFDAADATRMMNINIDGTANVVNQALEQGIKKLCYVSSVAAIGKEVHPKCSSEDSEWSKTKETSNYSISKHYAETEVWRASEEGLNVVIVNPALILGYGNWNKGSLSIIKRVKEGLSYFPPGANSFVGVEDVAKIMILLMESNRSAERFILSSENLCYKELLEKIAISLKKKVPAKKAPARVAKAMVILDFFRNALFGKPRVLTQESLNTSFNKKCYSNSKIMSTINYPFEKIEDVLEKSAEKYRQFPFN